MDAFTAGFFPVIAALFLSQYRLLASVQSPVNSQLLTQFLNNPIPAIGGTLSIIGFIISQVRKVQTDVSQRQREALTTWKDLADSRAQSLSDHMETIHTLQIALSDAQAQLKYANEQLVIAETSLRQSTAKVVRLQSVADDAARRMREINTANTLSQQDKKNLSETED